MLARTATLLALIAGLLLAFVAPATAAPSYPYATQSDVNAVDPWGMTERQCTSYVAWRAHLDGHDIPAKNYPAGTWNARDWDDQARRLGRPVDHTPHVGDFAQWDANERVDYRYQGRSWWMQAGPLGHIAYVAAVNRDGTVTLNDYNWFGGARAPGTKTLPAAAVPRFIDW